MILRQNVELFRAAQPGLAGISVHSSSYAVAIYEKPGFRRAGERQVRNGIGFTPRFWISTIVNNLALIYFIILPPTLFIAQKALFLNT